MTNADLRQRAQAIINLMDQADEIKAEIADLFEAAKGAGYTPKALRQAIKVHRLDANRRATHDSAQMDFEMYLAELEGNAISEAA